MCVTSLETANKRPNDACETTRETNRSDDPPQPLRQQTQVHQCVLDFFTDQASANLVGPAPPFAPHSASTWRRHWLRLRRVCRDASTSFITSSHACDNSATLQVTTSGRRLAVTKVATLSLFVYRQF